MNQAYYKDVRTGFRPVEVLGDTPKGRVRIRESDGRERTCKGEELYAYTEESRGYVEEMVANATRRQELSQRDLELARLMPPYVRDGGHNAPLAPL